MFKDNKLSMIWPKKFVLSESENLLEIESSFFKDFLLLLLDFSSSEDRLGGVGLSHVAQGHLKKENAWKETVSHP